MPIVHHPIRRLAAAMARREPASRGGRWSPGGRRHRAVDALPTVARGRSPRRRGGPSSLLVAAAAMAAAALLATAVPRLRWPSQVPPIGRRPWPHGSTARDVASATGRLWREGRSRLARLVRHLAAPPPVTAQAAVVIASPPAAVFEVLRRIEAFPAFLSHLRSVDVRPDGTSRWTIVGPFGLPLAFDVEAARSVPDRLVAWRSRPGSGVAYAGRIQLDGLPAGRTRVVARIVFRPPAGALGEAVASALGPDPASTLNGDLDRLRRLVEHGRTSSGARPTTIAEVAPGVFRTVPAEPAGRR